MTPQELRLRLARFSVAVEALTRPMLSRIETRDTALQLRRSSTGMSSNHRVCGRARSHAEFTSKLSVALEEADESLGWLEFLADTKLADAEALRPLLREARELVAILTTSTQTARRRKKSD
jgi:four helix bundle protein